MKTTKNIENYKNDEFIDGKCFDENGTESFSYYINPNFQV
jgi:protein TonB